MEKIIVQDFGPISHFESKLLKFNIIIGPQASGKSTISKLVYFFKTLNTHIIQELALPEDWDKKFDLSPEEILETVRKSYALKFKDLFYASIKPTMNIIFEYGINRTINVTSKSGIIQIVFSESYTNDILEALAETKRSFVDFYKKNSDPEKIQDSLRLNLLKAFFSHNISLSINKLFFDKRRPIFIPAGRTVTTILSSQLINVETSSIDFFTREFLKIIFTIRTNFSKPIKEIIKDKRAYSNKFDTSTILLAQEIIHSILKGEYQYSNGEEQIVINKKTSIKLNFTSSGQQESLWILLISLVVLLENIYAFLVVEEPEAHLHPNAQKMLIDLLALVANQRNNVLLTTHSPYILTSINNLVYADLVGKRSPTEVNKIVNRHFWLESSNVNCIYLKEIKNQSVSVNIIDPETKLICAEKIDEISSTLNTKFSEMFELNG